MTEPISDLAKTYLKAFGLYETVLDTNSSGELRATLIARAEKAAAEVEQKYRQMHASGELKELNQNYRDYRLGCKEDGATAISWNKYLAMQKRETIRRMVAEVNRRRGGV